MMRSTSAIPMTDSILWHVKKDFTSLQQDWTVAQTLDHLRVKPPEGRIIYFYVINPEEKLVGVVPVRRLLLSAPDATLKSIMIKGVIAIPQAATVLDACEFFSLHRLLAFPVVDEQRRIQGVVDVELYTEELADDPHENTDVVFQLIGVHLSNKPRTAWRGFIERFPWLICNIVGGILAAFISGIYEEELATAVTLSLFIPVVLTLAESVAIQSVTLALQGLGQREVKWKRLAKDLRLEFMTGLMLGLACATVVGIVELIWKGEVTIFFCLMGGIGGGVAMAAVIGVLMPNLLHLTKRDPQVAAGPIALTITDVTTLLVYFNLARMLITK
jgi:magnesium transporter